MNKILTTAYQTWDGRIFTTEQDAIYHEQWTSYYKMFNRDGSETNDCDFASFVLLFGKNAAEGFIANCENAASSHKGINCGDEGFYIYIDHSYYKLDYTISTFAQALQNINNQMKENNK